MSKQPPANRDRFRIIAETASENMGPLLLLAQLTRMGLENIGYELVTDGANWKKKGAGARHEVRAEEAVVEWIKEHPMFNVSDLIRHFRECGRMDGAGCTAVRVLVERKLGPGNYQRADVKAIEGPKVAAGSRSAAKPRRANVVRRYDILNPSQNRK